jgi:hypothetical protein
MDEPQEETETKLETGPEPDINEEILFEARTICENAGFIVTTSSDLLKVWGFGLFLTIILGLTIGFTIFSVYKCN